MMEHDDRGNDWQNNGSDNNNDGNERLGLESFGHKNGTM